MEIKRGKVATNEKWFNLPVAFPVPRPEHRTATPLFTHNMQVGKDRLALRQVDLPIPHLTPAFDGYQIVHLSDLHFGPAVDYRNVMNAILVAKDLAADLIVITGDFVSNLPDRFLMPDALSRLCAPDGVWGVLGNHDIDTGAEEVTRILSESGVRILRNASVPIQRGSDTIWLAGVDDVLSGGHDLQATLAGIPDSVVTVLMVHEPDYADVVAETGRVSLQLSGHCHGGPPHIPVLGQRLFSRFVKMGRNYPYGLYRTAGMWLYTSAGAGRGSLPRFNGLPEVAKITLRCQKPNDSDNLTEQIPPSLSSKLNLNYGVQY